MKLLWTLCARLLLVNSVICIRLITHRTTRSYPLWRVFTKISVLRPLVPWGSLVGFSGSSGIFLIWRLGFGISTQNGSEIRDWKCAWEVGFRPGGTPLYNPNRYVPPQRVWFLGLFGLKTGNIHFAHFGLESGVVFEGTAGVYKHIYRFNSKWIRMK